MHTQHIILAATTLAALLILIATAYLAGRKDRKNALQQAVGEELRHNVEAEATEKLADWQQRHEEQQAELKRLEMELETRIATNHRQGETVTLLREQNLAAEELDAIRTASRLLSGHARQFQKTGTTKRNADAEAQQQLAAILQRLAITKLASHSADAEAQEAA
ncbi:hypothetical protein ACOAOH_25275 [Pseudomonas aeruginosa]|uniref:hypothetical protein n=1 Tax=Pseudomonas aeruginosa TaxID=287 RepID=UPI00044D95C7|nr:hypothetical protein [Pseudomonas aeruginosa]EKX6241284.1 hypothetical protein [Pseudomonas aeruginosa]ETV22813.1 hypothetical protein Q048_04773 [Pseudomonas aeruginosa BWHPSA043]MBI8681507.1 hypothetical protein [Pseudomonas aeruginosa]RQH91491.1 hypothetical protein IPC96_25070 [Pseudomonas aeruginosa]HBP0144588.1 hypothetical protein [Pseudomonas aeruginosa]